MALWGKADGIFSPGTVTVDYANKTITGAGSSFLAAGVAAGAVITIGAGGTFGNAVISGITSETQISIATTQYLSTAIPGGVTYSISRKPVYTLEDKNFSTITGAGNSSSTNRVYGVDENEQTAATQSGLQYAASHAGWVGVHTYIDCEQKLRVKTEVLVAMSGISTGTASYTSVGDAADDTVLPDRYITISSQPSNLGLTTTTSGTFTVTASATPAAALSYLWKVSTNGGTSYANASGGIYSNGTTATLTLTNPALSASGNLYRVVISSTGGAPDVTSNAATLAVTA
jgi:hypothetical protein